jgi:hypothetical protein
LNLGLDADDNQWTDEHRTVDELCVLAIATKRGKWLAPRSLWPALPGGMPYVQFNLDGYTADDQKEDFNVDHHD